MGENGFGTKVSESTADAYLFAPALLVRCARVDVFRFEDRDEVAKLIVG